MRCYLKWLWLIFVFRYLSPPDVQRRTASELNVFSLQGAVVLSGSIQTWGWNVNPDNSLSVVTNKRYKRVNVSLFKASDVLLSWKLCAGVVQFLDELKHKVWREGAGHHWFLGRDNRAEEAGSDLHSQALGAAKWKYVLS